MVRKDCCWAHFNDLIGTETGSETVCPECRHHYIFDGNEWRDLLDIGYEKARKFRRLATVNSRIKRNLAKGTP